MDLKTFRQIVDQCGPGIAAGKRNLAEMYAYVGLPTSESMTQKMLLDALHRKCGEAFSSGHSAVFYRCKEMLDELIHRYIVDDESPSPYFRILESVRDANRGHPRSDNIVGNWQEAAQHAIDLQYLFNLDTSPGSLEVGYRETFASARAAKRLLNAGCELDRTNGGIRFTAASEAWIVAEIEERVAFFGGVAVARAIFRGISGTYDPAMERYHIGRVVTYDPKEGPMAPVGYLLQIAAKRFKGKKPLRNSPKDWVALISLATDYAAVLGVQTYGHTILWGRVDAKDYFQKLREFAVHDALFCIPQIRGSDVIDIAKGVFDGINFDAVQKGNWSLADAFQVISYILDVSRAERGPRWIALDDVVRALSSISRARITAVLENLLSHPSAGPNQRFTKPTDAHDATVSGPNSPVDDFYERPLIKDGVSSYLLLDRAMCAPAFLEAVVGTMKSAFPSSGAYADHLGKGIERMLKSRFAAKGIPTQSGRYNVDGEDGECDIVVETEKVVFFIEVKRKSLSAQARAGSDLFVILDLARSALKAQVQAGWNEVRLRRRRAIDLIDERNNTYRLELAGRDVERIAISLAEFGSFQDRSVLMGFLESHLGASYTVSLPKYQDRIDQINALLREIDEQEKELSPQRGQQYSQFANCWFLSLPQMLIVLDDARDAQSFHQALWTTRSLSHGTLDFYREFAAWKSMKAGAAAEAAAAAKKEEIAKL